MKKLILLFSLFFFLMAFAQEKKEINTDTKTENIEKQISDLQKQIKVLEEQQLNKSKELENTYKNNIEIIEKVEGFYDRSWEKLIFIISIVGALVGVVVPSMITWWQNKNFNKEQEKFKSQLAETKKNFKIQLNNSYKTFQKQLQEKIIENEQRFKNEINETNQMFSSEISSTRISLQEDFNTLVASHFLVFADINTAQHTFDKSFYCLGKVIEFNLKNRSLNQDNILFVIEKMEGLILMVKQNKFPIIFDNEELKKNVIDSLNSITSMDLEVIPPNRIDQIINFIKNH